MNLCPQAALDAAALPGLGPALPPGFQSPSALELGFSYSDGKPLTDSPFNWRFLLSFALSLLTVAFESLLAL